MQEAGVTVEQIKTGIYMNALSEKESLALVLKDLAANYQFQFGPGDFDLLVSDKALKYYPTGAYLYMVKFEHYRQQLLTARKNKDKKEEDECNKALSKIDKKMIELAYKQPSKEEYEQWVKENEKNKTLYGVTTNNKQQN